MYSRYPEYINFCPYSGFIWIILGSKEHSLAGEQEATSYKYHRRAKKAGGHIKGETFLRNKIIKDFLLLFIFISNCNCIVFYLF